jgi:hypothetical protein
LSRTEFVEYRKVIGEDPSTKPMTPPDFSTLRISFRAPSGAARCWRTAHAKVASNERQGVFSQVDADRFAWRHRLRKVDGDRAGTAPAVEESHPGSQMRREKSGHPSGAVGEDSTVPFGVYPYGRSVPRI